MEMQFAKVNVEIKKLNEGESFIGKFVETSKRPWFDREKQEEVEIDQYHFTDTKGENPFVYFGDGGFKNTITTANIKSGDVIKVVKLPKASLGGGRTVNNYELYKALQS